MFIIMSHGLVYESEIQTQWKTMNKHNIETFESCLVGLYEQTLIFLVAASDHYSKGSLRRTWNAVWDSSSVTNFDEETTKLENQLHGEAETRSRIGIQGDLSSIRYSNAALGAKLNEMQDEERKKREEHQEHEKRAEHSRILRWLSQFPYEDHHNFAKTGRALRTGGWIFRKDEYNDWYYSPDRDILWIHGIRKL
jgi:hypothetical protein